MRIGDLDMGKIVAIGGGEIGRPGYPVETTEIDMRIVELTGKSRPSILFLPTASGDSDVYVETFSRHFRGRLGCRTDALCLLKTKPELSEIEEKVLGSDAVYVGGGNTARMMRARRKWDLEKILRTAYDSGIVMSGLSAGAICWFRYGCSDSRRFANPEADLIRVSGLGLLNATLCPHYDVEQDRKANLRDMMKRTPGVAIALDNCCAIEVVDDAYTIIASKPGAGAYRVYWSAGTFYEEALRGDNASGPLEGLLARRERRTGGTDSHQSDLR
ncbi:MAG: hypothetical protein A2Z18_08205 [Armatimonadetes bacterium RBG_16_58_9]|nr:MAG: hypothetical protein A2Z18_08205 [Armatimonadetes bacterium RBG_16_58_9]